MSKSKSEYRVPTEYEANLIGLFLKQNFVGVEEVRLQLKEFLVKNLDAEGSIGFLLQGQTPLAIVRHRVPVEACALDKDGVMIHALLHILDGRAEELEFYKDDSSEILEYPTSWEFLVL